MTPPPDPRSVRVVVNGREHTLPVTSSTRLLDLLRDDLGLTAAKEGCGCGECGACTVLLDGRPVNACLVPAAEVDGARVTTLEGLDADPVTARLQRAFVAAGAVQCGYCTPGMVMSAAALLRRDPDPGEEDIRQALSANVCRCTGYQQLVRGVRMAATGDIPDPPPPRIGAGAAREDAADKVRGRTRYTADRPRPEGMLHAAVARSERVHARLLSVDLSGALAVPGVVDAFTHEAIPGETTFGNAVADQPVLAIDRLRFVGEAVAVVVAESPEAAAEGAAAVRVEAVDLPPVLDPVEALRPGAPAVHEGREGGNLLTELRLSRGDAARAIAGAATVVERTYRTTWQEHACLETEVAEAEPDGDGGIVVRCPSQNVFFDRLHVCRALGLERSKVRVIQQPTGAAFGGREDIYAQTHAALAAQRTGRPVRLLWSREESQVATTKRHPVTATYRAGLDGDGRLVGLEVEVVADTGAYASWGPNISRKALVHAAGPFAVDDVRVRVRAAYTNNGISGAFRGFGATQVTFAYGSFAAEMARAAGLDHVEFLRRNHLRVGSTTATGQIVRGGGLAVCLERMTEVLGPPPRHDPAAGVRRGRGIASFLYGIGYGNAIPDIGSAVVELADDGAIEVRCGAVDYGQGARTVFLQIACDVLGLRADQVRVVTGDTHRTPDSGSTVASRQTVVSGSAVLKAARGLRDVLVELAAAEAGVDPGRVVIGEEGAVVDGTPVAGWAALAEALRRAGRRPGKQARYRLRSGRLDGDDGQGDAYGTYAWGCHAADVAVDEATGRVTVERFVAVHDVGRAINPVQVEGQIAGGVVMGLGFALSEAHRIVDGRPVTRNLDTYRLPMAADVPPVRVVVVEEPDDAGPFGARGIGEPSMIGVAPAVANAVEDALGVRVRELPLRSEVIWAEMEPGSSRDR